MRHAPSPLRAGLQIRRALVSRPAHRGDRRSPFGLSAAIWDTEVKREAFDPIEWAGQATRDRPTPEFFFSPVQVSSGGAWSLQL